MNEISSPQITIGAIVQIGAALMLLWLAFSVRKANKKISDLETYNNKENKQNILSKHLVESYKTGLQNALTEIKKIKERKPLSPRIESLEKEVNKLKSRATTIDTNKSIFNNNLTDRIFKIEKKLDSPFFADLPFQKAVSIPFASEEEAKQSEIRTAKQNILNYLKLTTERKSFKQIVEDMHFAEGKWLTDKLPSVALNHLLKEKLIERQWATSTLNGTNTKYYTYAAVKQDQVAPKLAGGLVAQSMVAQSTGKDTPKSIDETKQTVMNYLKQHDALGVISLAKTLQLTTDAVDLALTALFNEKLIERQMYYDSQLQYSYMKYKAITKQDQVAPKLAKAEVVIGDVKEATKEAEAKILHYLKLCGSSNNTGLGPIVAATGISVANVQYLLPKLVVDKKILINSSPINVGGLLLLQCVYSYNPDQPIQVGDMVEVTSPRPGCLFQKGSKFKVDKLDGYGAWYAASRPPADGEGMKYSYGADFVPFNELKKIDV